MPILIRPTAALLALVLCVAITDASRSLPHFDQWMHRPPEEPGSLWALLVAGSAGYGNYRHQADVAHAYHVLRRGGIPEQRILVMMYDDVAWSPQNPRPGTLYNHPSLTQELRGGLRIDYSGDHVNAQEFLAVLSGNVSAVPRGPNASGRVIEAGPSDRVFVFYSDHGAPGILGMPSGDFLYADQLHTAIKHRAKHNGFLEMTLYIEACESGSMFKGLLEQDLGVFAVTAANSHESSWGTYCPGMEGSPPSEYTTCLGDLFSVAWTEDSDLSDLTHESLKAQFKKVRARTSQNYTYLQGSHAERFGQLELQEEEASNFLGTLNKGQHANGQPMQVPQTIQGAIAQRDADLVHLESLSQRGDPAATAELQAQRSHRVKVDKAVQTALTLLLRRTNALGLLKSHGARLTDGSFDALGGQDISMNATAAWLVAEAVTAPVGDAVVSDWQCLRDMVAAWQRSCGPLDQYTMKHTRAFANLCNIGIEAMLWESVAKDVCCVEREVTNDVSEY